MDELTDTQKRLVKGAAHPRGWMPVGPHERDEAQAIVDAGLVVWQENVNATAREDRRGLVLTDAGREVAAEIPWRVLGIGEG